MFGGSEPTELDAGSEVGARIPELDPRSAASGRVSPALPLKVNDVIPIPIPQAGSYSTEEEEE